MENSWLVSTSSLWGVGITWHYVKGPAYSLNPQVHFGVQLGINVNNPWMKLPIQTKRGMGTPHKMDTKYGRHCQAPRQNCDFLLPFFTWGGGVARDETSSKGSKPISYNTNWSQHQSKVPRRGFFPHRQNMKTRLEYCPKWSTKSKHTIRKSQIASKKFIFRKILSCEIEFLSWKINDFWKVLNAKSRDFRDFM